MVRVFANKYPATHPFSLDHTLHKNLLDTSANPKAEETILHEVLISDRLLRPRGNQAKVCSNIHQSQTFSGAHEVIVESSAHVSSLSKLPVEHIELAVQAYRSRLRELRQNKSLQYAVLFKNAGPEAGASLEHTHSQLIACDLIPTSVIHRLTRLHEYQLVYGRCFLCDVIQKEMESCARVVATTNSFLAYCPYASRLPFTVNLIPKVHAASFEDMDADQLSEFAMLLRRAIRWFESMHTSASYNFIVHTMPWACSSTASYHWYVELFPRLTTAAGFEWASECFINTESPESAAARFRNIDAGIDSNS
jgi:UDPglucose--hexose-1-phosphate uridylyltransferase